MRWDVGKRIRSVGSGLIDGGWKFRRFRAGFGWNWRIRWRVGGAGIGGKGDGEGFAGIRGGKRGGSTGRGEWNGGSRGGIRLILRGRSVRRTGKAGRDDLGRKSNGLRDRRRRGHAGEVRSELLLIRGRIGKVRCGSRKAPLLENREKWGTRLGVGLTSRV